MHKDSEYGRLSVNDEILSQLTSRAVIQVPGVLGLMLRSKNQEGTHDGSGVMEHAGRGVSIGVDSLGRVVIEISIAVRYGVRIKDVGLEVVRTVDQVIWDAVSLSPYRVVVHVEGVRKS